MSNFCAFQSKFYYHRLKALESNSSQARQLRGSYEGQNNALPGYEQVLCVAGMGKGAGAEPGKTRTPLAEQTIDPHTMPMKTIIKCAMAKDRVKASAEQAAKVNTLALDPQDHVLT